MFKRIKKWLFALIGKPIAENVEMQNAPIEKEKTPQEDSISNDILMFKSFIKKGVGLTKTFVEPYTQKGTESVSDTTKAVKSAVDKKFIKFTVRAFIIIFFTIILVVIVTYLTKRLKEESGSTHQSTTAATPTPIFYDLYKPSIYAQDPEILILEEETNILEGEIKGIIIRETGITPPVLDFNISF